MLPDDVEVRSALSCVLSTSSFVYKGRSNALRYVCSFHRNRVPLLIILAGTSCTGKSTLATKVRASIAHCHVLSWRWISHVHAMLYVNDSSRTVSTSRASSRPTSSSSSCATSLGTNELTIALTRRLLQLVTLTHLPLTLSHTLSLLSLQPQRDAVLQRRVRVHRRAPARVRERLRSRAQGRDVGH